MFKGLVYCALALALVLAPYQIVTAASVKLPADKDFQTTEEKGEALCSGSVSKEGLMTMARVENKSGVFMLYVADTGKFVVAYFKTGEEVPSKLFLGTVKDGKLVVEKERKFGESDTTGPCPLVYPAGA